MGKDEEGTSDVLGEVLKVLNWRWEGEGPGGEFGWKRRARRFGGMESVAV